MIIIFRSSELLGDMVHFRFCDFASLLYLYQLKQCSNWYEFVDSHKTVFLIKE